MFFGVSICGLLCLKDRMCTERLLAYTLTLALPIHGRELGRVMSLLVGYFSEVNEIKFVRVYLSLL
jgi:hypothetical protein